VIWLTVGETARILRVSRSSVYRWINSEPPTLGYFKMPTGSVRVSGCHLRRFLEEHESAVDAEQEELNASGWAGDGEAGDGEIKGDE
jgi:hypothetical protein